MCGTPHHNNNRPHQKHSVPVIVVEDVSNLLPEE